MIPAVSSILSRCLLDRAGGHRSKVLAAFRDKIREDHLSERERKALATQRLLKLLVHCRGHVPFYSSYLRDEVNETNAWDVLSALPSVSRADMQDAPGVFKASGTPVSATDATGGSTGTPLRFDVDGSTQLARESSLLWSNSLSGWKMGERIAMLWGSDRDVVGASGNWRLAARWWIENRRWFNAFEMGEQQMRTFHAELERFRPHLVVAYASAAHSYARFLIEAGIQPGYPLNGIVSSAEVLTPDMRAVVEQAFQKPVFDRYGNREFGAIAAECVAHDGLHLNETDAVVEIDSSDPSRIPGRLLVTYLRNFAMPFVRYDTGDMALLTPAGLCPCGSKSARLSKVVGRQSDMIRAADGTLIHGEYFTHMMYTTTGVRKFQFVQESMTRCCLRLEGTSGQLSANEDEWRRQIGEKLGAEVEVEIEYVDHIPELSSGKHRFTVSNLKTD